MLGEERLLKIESEYLVHLLRGEMVKPQWKMQLVHQKNSNPLQLRKWQVDFRVLLTKKREEITSIFPFPWSLVPSNNLCYLLIQHYRIITVTIIKKLFLFLSWCSKMSWSFRVVKNCSKYNPGSLSRYTILDWKRQRWACSRSNVRAPTVKLKNSYSPITQQELWHCRKIVEPWSWEQILETDFHLFSFFSIFMCIEEFGFAV